MTTVIEKFTNFLANWPDATVGPEWAPAGAAGASGVLRAIRTSMIVHPPDVELLLEELAITPGAAEQCTVLFKLVHRNTRIIKLGRRRGDNAPMSLVEFVELGSDGSGSSEKSKGKGKPKKGAAEKAEAAEAKSEKAEAAEKPKRAKKPKAEAEGDE